MKEMKMIEAFAELEGVNIVDEYRGTFYVRDVTDGTVSINGYSHSSYNPLLPNSLNCAARDKYGVTVIYKKYGNCIVKIDSLENVIGCGVHVDFVPKAVIEVILKSKGKWVE